MQKKIINIFLVLVILVISLMPNFAHAEEKGKDIVIFLNKYGLTEMDGIEYLQEKLKNEGYMGLMNVRAAKGISDSRSYASMGWGTRALVNELEDMAFENLNDSNSKIYELRTNQKPLAINNLSINTLIMTNVDGDYGAIPGLLGKELRDNAKVIGMLGNADIDIQKNRQSSLAAMDEWGRIPLGDIENINKKDSSFPFGIRTDYDVLKKKTDELYKKTDVLMVDLGDTYRLDEYRKYMNENAYINIKAQIDSDISSYLKHVFELKSKNDRVYIVSPFPESLSYKEGYRLSPIFMFKDTGKGLISSSTTRRPGVVGNVDLGKSILLDQGIDSQLMAGRQLEEINYSNPKEFLTKDYDRMVSLAMLRVPVLYTYAVFEMIVWVVILGMIAFWSKINEKLRRFLVFTLKFTLVIPVALLVVPMFSVSNPVIMIVTLIATMGILYFLFAKLIKDSLWKLIAMSFAASILILVDGATGQNLIKNSLLGYDAIIGARYYGIGNEYMGVIIGAAILTAAGLLEKKKIKKWMAGLFLLICMAILGYPKMGANVGGTITAVCSYLFFMMRVYDIKVDFKKVMLIGLAVVAVVGTFAFIDLHSGGKSHLAGALTNIKDNGVIVILQIIQRKIEMNMKLIGVSIWSKVFLLALAIVAYLFYKPFGVLKSIQKKYPIMAKSWYAIIVGSVVGFLVNDSGIVAAATSIPYMILPVLMFTIEEFELDGKSKKV